MLLPEWLHRTLRLPYFLKVSRHGRGPVVVFLHGIVAHRGIWAPAMAGLENRYTCISIDLLGHGESPKPTHMMYTVDDHLRSIRWTLFWHGIWGKVTLVGHSMGAIISTHYAAVAPRKIRALILCALPIYRTRDSIEEKRRFEALLDSGYLRFYRALRALPKGVVVRSAHRLVRMMPTIEEQAIINEHTWYPAVSSLANTIEQHTILEDVARLQPELPVTVISGRLDHLVIGANLKLAFAHRTDVQFVRIMSGHEVTKPFTREVIRAVRELS